MRRHRPRLRTVALVAAAEREPDAERVNALTYVDPVYSISRESWGTARS